MSWILRKKKSFQMYECKNFANEFTQIDFLEVDVSLL